MRRLLILPAAMLITAFVFVMVGQYKPAWTPQEVRAEAVMRGAALVKETLKSPENVIWELQAYNIDKNLLCYKFTVNGITGYSVISDGYILTSGAVYRRYCKHGDEYETVE